MSQTLDAIAALAPSRGDEAEALIARYIEQDPNRPGRHEAWVEEGQAGAQVWFVINYLRAASPETVASEYGLSRQALAAAVAYYLRHRELIDAFILVKLEAAHAWAGVA